MIRVAVVRDLWKEPGQLADLVVLESDPRKVEPRAISDIEADQTWMDGRQVYGG